MARHSSLEPAHALFRVFIAPHLQGRIQPPAQWSHMRPSVAISTQRRQTYAVRKAAAPAEVRRERWNDQILAKMVSLVDSETGKPQPPCIKRDVLFSIDLKTQRLVQLVPDEPKNPDFVPVCKIVNIKDVYQQQKEKKEANKEAKKTRSLQISLKTIELNWAIDQNDLDHRLEKMKEFLEEGRKVEIVLAAKKRGRRASMDECQEVMSKINSVVADIKGVKETKAMEGKIGAVAMLSYQGKSTAATGAKQAQPAPVSE